jgi:hypothetical protein
MLSRGESRQLCKFESGLHKLSLERTETRAWMLDHLESVENINDTISSLFDSNTDSP